MEGPAEVLQNEIVSCAPSLVKRDGPPQRARKCVKRDQTRLQNEYGTFDHSLHKNFCQLLICAEASPVAVGMHKALLFWP